MRDSSITVNLTTVAEKDMRGILSYLLYYGRVDISLYAKRVRASVKAIYLSSASPNLVYSDLWRSQNVRAPICADIIRSWKDYCRSKDIRTWPLEVVFYSGGYYEDMGVIYSAQAGKERRPDVSTLCDVLDAQYLANNSPLSEYETYDRALRTMRRDLRRYRKCCSIAKDYPFGSLFVQKRGD
jgi:hypothetical protein